MQGHKQNKINFDSPATRNEGNFIALLRLLAGTNSCLDQHLRTGPANAKYINKNIQNEILEIAADEIRDFYRDCLKECAHFSVVADEVTSHGQEIVSVCLRFLEVHKDNFELKPEKHEVLLDFSFLQRITGESIAQGILCVLEKHKIDIRNCRMPRIIRGRQTRTNPAVSLP